LNSLPAASAAAASDGPYGGYLARSASLAADRDRLAQRMSALLDSATFDRSPIDPAVATSLVEQANVLLGRNI
jgi:hypothetical protein